MRSSLSFYTPAFLPEGLCTYSFCLDNFLPGFSCDSNIRQGLLWPSKLRKFPAPVPLTSLCLMFYSQNKSLWYYLALCLFIAFPLSPSTEGKILENKNLSALSSLYLQHLERCLIHKLVLNKSLWNEWMNCIVLTSPFK